MTCTISFNVSPSFKCETLIRAKMISSFSLATLFFSSFSSLAEKKSQQFSVEKRNELTNEEEEENKNRRKRWLPKYKFALIRKWEAKRNV